LAACCLRHGIVCESIARMFVISGGIRSMTSLDATMGSVGPSVCPRSPKDANIWRLFRELSDSYSTSSELIEDTMIS